MKTIRMSDLARHIYHFLKDLPLIVTRSKRPSLAVLSYEEYKNLQKIKKLAEKANLIPKDKLLPENLNKTEEIVPEVPPQKPIPIPSQQKATSLLEEFLKKHKKY